MDHVKQDGRTCLLACAAMVFRMSLEDVVEYCGHDGSRIEWDDGEIIGVHMQTVVELGLSRGYALTRIEIAPGLRHPKNSLARHVYSTPSENMRVLMYLLDRLSIIITSTHACVYDGNTFMLHDPRLRNPDRFLPTELPMLMREFYIVQTTYRHHIAGFNQGWNIVDGELCAREDDIKYLSERLGEME